MSLLGKISNKYTLKNLFDFIPYNIRLKITYGNKKLLDNLDITRKVYEKYNIITKILKISSDIQKLSNYLDIINILKNQDEYTILNELNINEKILYACLNNASFNTKLFVENQYWEKFIKYVNKIQLIISPNLVKYLFNLSYKERQSIYNLLNLYKNNIVEITICNFNKEMKMNYDGIDKITTILHNIFQIKTDNEFNNNSLNNNLDKANNISNETNTTHKVKKLSFESNQILPFINIKKILFDNINNILALEKIEDFYIDLKYYNYYQLKDSFNYISEKMHSLNKLKLNNFNFNKNQYEYFNIIFIKKSEKIEKLDLSGILLSYNLISILNIKCHPLKELKIKMDTQENEINWDFLEKSIKTLEIFEIELIEKIKNNIDSLINMLNKLVKLKHVKIISAKEISKIMRFRNNTNIQYFNVDFYLINDKNDINEYFSKFLELKSLILENKNSFVKPYYAFRPAPKSIFCYFPNKLKYLELVNLDGKNIFFLLNKNNNNLANIEELIIENSNFFYDDLNCLPNLFLSYKLIEKLILNKLEICDNQICFQDFDIYVSKILKNVPSIIELFVNIGEFKEKIFQNKLLKIKD